MLPEKSMKASGILYSMYGEKSSVFFLGNSYYLMLERFYKSEAK